MATAKGIGTEEEEVNPYLAQDMVGPPLRLTQALNLSEISSESGTVFEVEPDQFDKEEQQQYLQQQQQNTNFFDDASLISSLSLSGGLGDDETQSDQGDEEPFERLAQRMEDITGDGGVLKMEVKAGVGPNIADGAMVTFHYMAFLEYSDEPFDSTMLRGRPERKLLDTGEILPGLNIAIKTMRCSETSRFLIKPQYAFGKLGCPPRIPGNEILLYEVRLLSAVDRAAADTYDDMEEAQQSFATFQEKLEAAQAYQRLGNQYYQEGNYHVAKNNYYRAAWILEYTALKDHTEEVERGNLLIRLRSNLAQVYLLLKEPAHACTQCRLGLAVTGEHSKNIIAKLHYRYGKAKNLLQDFKAARHHLLQAHHLKPGWEEVVEELEALVKSEEKWALREKFMCQRIFGTSATKKSQDPPGAKSSKAGVGANSSAEL